MQPEARLDGASPDPDRGAHHERPEAGPGYRVEAGLGVVACGRRPCPGIGGGDISHGQAALHLGGVTPEQSSALVTREKQLLELNPRWQRVKRGVRGEERARFLIRGRILGKIAEKQLARVREQPLTRDHVLPMQPERDTAGDSGIGVGNVLHHGEAPHDAFAHDCVDLRKPSPLSDVEQHRFFDCAIDLRLARVGEHLDRQRTKLARSAQQEPLAPEGEHTQ